jgi:uncharacterized SAM-binding protein YcdF (DUF218 family)
VLPARARSVQAAQEEEFFRMATGDPTWRWKKTGVRWGLPLLLAAAVFVWGRFSGQWLIVDRPEKSDVIIVLAGDRTDLRYYRGLELLRSGYGQSMFVDAETNVKYGEAATQSTERFIEATAGDLRERIHVCPVGVTSTAGETGAVRACVAALHPRRILLVTNDFHSRRARSVFERRLPEYSWSIAAVRDDEEFGALWWRRRAWAKTYLMEWERLAWWFVIER